MNIENAVRQFAGVKFVDGELFNKENTERTVYELRWVINQAEVNIFAWRLYNGDDGYKWRAWTEESFNPRGKKYFKKILKQSI